MKRTVSLLIASVMLQSCVINAIRIYDNDNPCYRKVVKYKFRKQYKDSCEVRVGCKVYIIR
jgi:hypothetical protein